MMDAAQCGKVGRIRIDNCYSVGWVALFLVFLLSPQAALMAQLGPAPAWIMEGNRPAAHLGQSLSDAGDVNGDGYDDVIIWGGEYPNYPYGGGDGWMYVYHGSPLGLGTEPACAIGDSNEGFGSVMSDAGDVNGDGYDDVIILVDADGGIRDRVQVYHGSPSGLISTAAWTVEFQEIHLPYWTSGAGDVNGDGYDDVILGVGGNSLLGNDVARVLVYHGSPTGLSLLPNWTAEQEQPHSYFGVVVSRAGDVNGDGYDDVIVEAPSYSNGEQNEGKAYVYHGSPSGLGLSPAWTAEGNLTDAQFGSGVLDAGDVNGDGYDDVIVSAYLYDYKGRVYVYHGSASGLSETAAWIVEGDQASSLFGVSKSVVGDVNGDGYDDVAVGARRYDNPEINEGRVYVYYGSPSGLSTVALWTAEGNQERAEFGRVSGAGDVNGDGYDDIMVGADRYSNPEEYEGRVFVYHGAPDGAEGEGEGEGEPAAATIACQPGPPFIAEGDRVTLTLVGTASTPFQWYKDDVPLTDAAPIVTGTQTQTLGINPVTLLDQGMYYATYQDGTKAIVQSQPFYLQVQPAGSVPVAGGLGLAALVLATVLGGVGILRRRPCR